MINSLQIKNTTNKFIRIAGENPTTYWRHQTHSEKCLATVEAIYYFYREYFKKK